MVPYEPTLYAVPFAASLLLMLWLASVLVDLTDERIGQALLLWSTATAVWSLSSTLRLSTTSPAHDIVLHNVRFLGPSITTPAFFLIAAAYSGRERLFEPRVLGVLFAIPALTNGLAWTNPWHSLVRTAVEPSTAGPLTLEITLGPWFVVHGLYSYALVAVGMYWLLDELVQRRRGGLYRGQAGFILIGTTAAMGPNVLFNTGLTTIDWTPVGSAAAGVFLSVALFRYRLLDISPVARDIVVENMDTGMLVVDTDGHVIDANDPAGRIVDAEPTEIIGTLIDDLFEPFPALQTAVGTGTAPDETVTVTTDNTTRHYDVTTSEIRDETDSTVGRAILFSDVTAAVERRERLRQQKQQLERQNERLDQFASVISHDLRNPLGIAQNYTDFAEESGDPDDFEAIRESLDRMDEMIDDMLTMARADTVVEDTETIDLDALVTDAWETTQTSDATLEAAIPAETTVEGDPALLRHVFENLFRNAVEHGTTRGESSGSGTADTDVRTDGDGITVTVGVFDTPDAWGFYIEDDGHGIPAAERDKIFEHGHTTSESGTGFGLAIVSDLIEAHGWTIAVADGTAGGARFDVTVENR